MPAGIIKLNITSTPIGVSIRRWRRAAKAGHLAMGQYWFRKFSRLHFGPAAGRRYHYRSRSTAYRLRKARLRQAGLIQGSAQDYLVSSGNLRQAALATQLKAFPTRVQISRRVPRYAAMNTRPGRPNLGQEQIVVIPSERDELTRVLDMAIQRSLHGG